MATVKAIKYGMKGDDVANLQSILNKLGYNLTVDGSFGPKTLAAVRTIRQKTVLLLTVWLDRRRSLCSTVVPREVQPAIHQTI